MNFVLVTVSSVIVLVHLSQCNWITSHLVIWKSGLPKKHPCLSIFSFSFLSYWFIEWWPLDPQKSHWVDTITPMEVIIDCRVSLTNDKVGGVVISNEWSLVTLNAIRINIEVHGTTTSCSRGVLSYHRANIHWLIKFSYTTRIQWEHQNDMNWVHKLPSSVK